MVSKPELNKFIAAQFGNGDSGVIGDFDTNADGQLSIGNGAAKEVNAADLAAAIVTDLKDAELELGVLQNEGEVKQAISDVFAADAKGVSIADKDDNGLTGEEIVSALQGVLQVENFGIIDKAKFEAQNYTHSDLQTAAGADNNTFTEAELTTYFGEIGVMGDNAALAASLLFEQASAHLTQSGEMTASDVLAFMSGTIGGDDPEGATATYETFSTAIQELLSGATAFDTDTDSTIDNANVIDLANAKNDELDVNHLTTFLETMGMTAGQSGDAAEYLLQHIAREDGDLGADKVLTSDLVKYIDSFSANGWTDDAKIGQYAFDQFTSYVEGEIGGTTPHVDTNTFETGKESRNGASTLNEIGGEDGAKEFLMELGVGYQNAVDIAKQMTEMDVFNKEPYKEMTFAEAIIGTAGETEITIDNLNKFVEDALSGNVFATFSYDENGFSQGMFNTAAGVDPVSTGIGDQGTINEAEAESVALDKTNFDANITAGLTPAYNESDVTKVLELLGIDPENAGNIAQYLIEQVGVSNTIPDDILFTTLAKVNATGANDEVIRRSDILQLIENAKTGAAIGAPLEDTINITAGDADTENTFAKISSSGEDASSISLTEFYQADGGASASDMLQKDAIIPLMESMGISVEKAEMIAEQALRDADTLDANSNMQISYADLFDLLTGGEETLTIDALQAYIDTIGERRGLPTESELSENTDLMSYHTDGTFDTIDETIAADIAAIIMQYEDAGAFEPDEASIASMIVQKHANVTAADADAKFTITDLHTVLTDYAEGIRSYDGTITGDGLTEETAFILDGTLADVTATDLASIGSNEDGEGAPIEDGQYIKFSNSGESADSPVYQVTVNGDGTYILTNTADPDDTRTISDAPDAEILGSGTDTDPYAIGAAWPVDVTFDQIDSIGHDFDTEPKMYIALGEGKFYVEKTDNESGTYVIKGQDGTPKAVVTADGDVSGLNHDVTGQQGVYQSEDGTVTHYRDNDGSNTVYELDKNGVVKPDSAGAGAGGDADGTFEKPYIYTGKENNEIDPSTLVDRVGSYVKSNVGADNKIYKVSYDDAGGNYILTEVNQTDGTDLASDANQITIPAAGNAPDAKADGGDGLTADTAFTIPTNYPDNVSIQDIEDTGFVFDDTNTMMYVTIGSDTFTIEKTDNGTDTYVVKDPNNDPNNNGEIKTILSEGNLADLDHQDPNGFGVYTDTTTNTLMFRDNNDPDNTKYEVTVKSGNPQKGKIGAVVQADGGAGTADGQMKETAYHMAGTDYISSIDIAAINTAATETGHDFADGTSLYITTEGNGDNVFTIQKTADSPNTYVVKDSSGTPVRVITAQDGGVANITDGGANNTVHTNGGKTYYKDGSGIDHELVPETGDVKENSGEVQADGGAATQISSDYSTPTEITSLADSPEWLNNLTMETLSDVTLNDVDANEKNGYIKTDNGTFEVSLANGVYRIFEVNGENGNRGDLTHIVRAESDVIDAGTLDNLTQGKVNRVTVNGETSEVYVNGNGTVYSLDEGNGAGSFDVPVTINEDGNINSTTASASTTASHNNNNNGDGSSPGSPIAVNATSVNANVLEELGLMGSETKYVMLDDDDTVFEVTANGNLYHVVKFDENGDATEDEYAYQRGPDSNIRQLSQEDSALTNTDNNQFVRTATGQLLYVKEGQTYMLANENGGKIGEAVDLNAEGDLTEIQNDGSSVTGTDAESALDLTAKYGITSTDQLTDENLDNLALHLIEESSDSNLRDGVEYGFVEIDGTVYEVQWVPDVDDPSVGEYTVQEAGGSGTDILTFGKQQDNPIDLGEGSVTNDKLNSLEPPLEYGSTAYVQSGGITYSVLVGGNNFNLIKLSEDGGHTNEKFIFQRTVGTAEENEIPVLDREGSLDVTTDLSEYDNQLVDKGDGNLIYIEDGEIYKLANGNEGGRLELFDVFGSTTDKVIEVNSDALGPEELDTLELLVSEEPIYIETQDGVGFEVIVRDNNYHLTQLSSNDNPAGTEYVFIKEETEDTTIEGRTTTTTIDNVPTLREDINVSTDLSQYNNQVVYMADDELVYIEDNKVYSFANKDNPNGGRLEEEYINPFEGSLDANGAIGVSVLSRNLQDHYDFTEEDADLIANNIYAAHDRPLTYEELEGIVDWNNNGYLEKTEFEYFIDHTNTDENIDFSNVEQGNIGNCWFLAGLIALDNTENGSDAVNKAIRTNSDAVGEDIKYTITFPGDTTKTEYEISANDISEAENQNEVNNQFSDGNEEMLALEIAAKQFMSDQPELFGGDSSFDGGFTSYVGTMFNVETEERYNRSDKDASLIDELIAHKEENPDNINLTFFAPTGEELKPKTSSGDGSHVWSITDIDTVNEIVYFVNPWDTSEILEASFEVFESYHITRLNALYP